MKRSPHKFAWDCGDEELDRIRSVRDREALRNAIAQEVLCALQYHSTTDEPDHVQIYLTPEGKLAIDLQLPGCIREVDLREVVEWQIEYSEQGGPDGGEISIKRMEALFLELARRCAQQ